MKWDVCTDGGDGQVTTNILDTDVLKVKWYEHIVTFLPGFCVGYLINFTLLFPVQTYTTVTEHICINIPSIWYIVYGFRVR